MTVTVEEARTLLGTAFIFSEVFDEYTYHAEPLPPRAARPQKPKPTQTDPNASGTESDSENGEDKEQSEELDNAAFEIPLNTLIECLNIFGTASAMNAMAAISGSSGGGGAPSNSKQSKKWRRVGDGDSDGEGRAGGRGLEAYFGPSAGEKRTGMRLSYPGAGYPLTLIMYVCLLPSFDVFISSDKSLIEQKMQLDLRRHVKSPLSIRNLSLSCIMIMTKRMFISPWCKTF
jgi:cell cycle checkpoint protein